jgi:hypothetical protein
LVDLLRLLSRVGLSRREALAEEISFAAFGFGHSQSLLKGISFRKHTGFAHIALT